MAGPNIARSAALGAAKAVGTEADTLNLGGIGSATLGRYDVDFQASPELVQQGNLFQQIAASQGQGAVDTSQGVERFGQQALGASTQMLQDAVGFDPLAAAEERYQRLRSVLDPQRQRDVAATEERLFRQGRLSSGEGATQLGEQQRAFAAEDALLLDRAFNEAQQARTSGIQTALQAGAAGTTANQSQIARAIEAAQAQQQAAKQPLGLGLTLSDLAAQRASAVNAFNTGSAQVDTSGGSGALLGGLAGGLGGAYFGGKEGAAQGAQLGAGIGSFF